MLALDKGNCVVGRVYAKPKASTSSPAEAAGVPNCGGFRERAIHKGSP